MRLAILYLDDSDLSLEAVKDGLEPLGIDVTALREPFALTGALAQHEPALLLLDAHLPGMESKQICWLVRQHRPHLPIVLFSAKGPQALRALTSDCGADGWIVKSAQFDQIAADIRRMAAKESS